MGMIGVTLTFDDRPAVWREVPALPHVGEALTYAGTPYRVRKVTWHGTDDTWAATVTCLRDHVEAEQLTSNALDNQLIDLRSRHATLGTAYREACAELEGLRGRLAGIRVLCESEHLRSRLEGIHVLSKVDVP